MVPDETNMLGEDDAHANAEPTFDMRTVFLSKLSILLQEKADNSWILSRDKYCTFTEDVKKAKAKQKKESVEYRRL
ncbi:hypothetical protein TNCT_695981 [Trichonephila clavata]|uniref:Uncharacterized protein n=1 Tax=Trichonephila clavata TaxID=2740835 RepID=A0A8X6I771_TRICU|nr:hypothetical protein TNCT_695981 [Trichonephila clavata]